MSPRLASMRPPRGGKIAIARICTQPLELFEEGIKVSCYCSSKLEEAERKVDVLIKTADGSIKEAPFSEEAEINEP